MKKDENNPAPQDDEVIEVEAEIVDDEGSYQQTYHYRGTDGQSRVFVYQARGCNCSCCLGCLLLLVFVGVLFAMAIY